MKSRLSLGASLAALCSICAAAGPQDSYLPLSPGARWVLRSRASAKPIVLEVLRNNGSAALLRFDNPWLTSEMELVPSAGRYYVQSLSINGQRAQMPPETLYWDTAAREHQKWSSAIGKMEVLSRRTTVQAMGRTFNDCLVIQETNKQGNKLYWTFAPGIGFVQFGEGRDAFVLESLNPGRDAAPGFRNSEQPAAPPPASYNQPGTNPPGARNGAVRVALAANTFANESFSPSAVQARFRQAVEAGVNLIYISPKWNEVETGRENYKLDDIRYQISEAADLGFPAILHLRIIDTNQRAVPSDLSGKAWDSAEMIARAGKLIDAVVPLLRNKVEYFLVGNEINGYFGQHRNEVDSYARLVSSLAGKIRNRVPGAKVSVSTNFDGIDDCRALLRPVCEKSDFFATTYYALSPSFMVRDPAGTEGDLQHLLQAAGNKKVFLQEVGYPTSPVNGSSEDKQAQTFSRVLDFAASHSDHFIGLNFTFMSDFSDSMVRQFTRYYGSGANQFGSFLKTLGMFDDQGRPKRSWGVFSQKVRSVTGAR